MGVYTIGSWEGEGEEGKGEERKGEDDKSSLGRVYCLLSSMSHVEACILNKLKPLFATLLLNFAPCSGSDQLLFVITVVCDNGV